MRYVVSLGKKGFLHRSSDRAGPLEDARLFRTRDVAEEEARGFWVRAKVLAVSVLERRVLAGDAEEEKG